MLLYISAGSGASDSAGVTVKQRPASFKSLEVIKYTLTHITDSLHAHMILMLTSFATGSKPLTDLSCKKRTFRVC